MMKIMLLVAALLMAACGGSSPTAPSTQTQAINVSGTWRGTYSSAQLGYGRAVLALVQSGDAVTGTWSTTPDSGGGAGVGAGTVSGTLTPRGSVASGSITLTMSPSNPLSCPFQFTGTASNLVTPKSIFGQWVTFNCTVTASGSLIVDTI